MEDWKERNKKMNTSFEAFNYIWAYVFMSLILGWALAGDWLMSQSLYGGSLIPDGYYWWVVGGFVFSSFAAVVGRYCMNASVDAG